MHPGRIQVIRVIYIKGKCCRVDILIVSVQVIQGIPTGMSNSTTIVAILSAPAWNVTAETLTFQMRSVMAESALKLRDGVANGAFASGRDSGLRMDAAGLVLKDVVLYIDDSSVRNSPQEVCPCTFLTMHCTLLVTGVFEYAHP